MVNCPRIKAKSPKKKCKIHSRIENILPLISKGTACWRIVSQAINRGEMKSPARKARKRDKEKERARETKMARRPKVKRQIMTITLFFNL